MRDFGFHSAIMAVVIFCRVLVKLFTENDGCWLMFFILFHFSMICLSCLLCSISRYGVQFRVSLFCACLVTDTRVKFHDLELFSAGLKWYLVSLFVSCNRIMSLAFQTCVRGASWRAFFFCSGTTATLCFFPGRGGGWCVWEDVNTWFNVDIWAELGFEGTEYSRLTPFILQERWYWFSSWSYIVV